MRLEKYKMMEIKIARHIIFFALYLMILLATFVLSY